MDNLDKTDIQELRNYLNECTLSANPDSKLRGHLDGTIDTCDSMPQNPTADEVVVYRRKPALVAREKQLLINLLGQTGGRPYVNVRLSQFSAESLLDWIGGTRPDGVKSTGRLQQTHSFPYLRRISDKINQHVFQKAPVREGADDDVVKDITRTNKSVNDVMRRISDYLFSCKWCWLMIDAPPPKGDGENYSVEEAAAKKIRPYWEALSPLNVLDWHFDATGTLVWIKTVEMVYDDSNPTTVPTATRVIKLWEVGKCTKYTVTERKDGRCRNGKRVTINKDEIPLTDTKGQPLKVVPFVLIGEADAKPHAFDDLESINRTIMDLGSVDRAHFFNSNYPQMVLPKSLLQTMGADNYASVAADIGRLLVGYKYPIMIEKDDVKPDFITSNASNLTAGSDRITTLKQELFEVTGMALESNGRQVESAEAKAWDFMDVSALMNSRAEDLENAERKAVAISKAWDADFKEWSPEYNRKFDIGNFKDELSTLIMAGNAPLPSSVHKEVVRLIVDRLDRLGSTISDEAKEEITEELKTWNPNDLPSLPA